MMSRASIRLHGPRPLHTDARHVLGRRRLRRAAATGRAERIERSRCLHGPGTIDGSDGVDDADRIGSPERLRRTRYAAAPAPPTSASSTSRPPRALQFTQDGVQVQDIPVTPGETVVIRVDNVAGFSHNFYIGTDAELSSPNATTDVGIPDLDHWCAVRRVGGTRRYHGPEIRLHRAGSLHAHAGHLLGQRVAAPKPMTTS